jgi:hypothetical protein
MGMLYAIEMTCFTDVGDPDDAGDREERLLGDLLTWTDSSARPKDEYYCLQYESKFSPLSGVAMLGST